MVYSLTGTRSKVPYLKPKPNYPSNDSLATKVLHPPPLPPYPSPQRAPVGRWRPQAGRRGVISAYLVALPVAVTKGQVVDNPLRLRYLGPEQAVKWIHDLLQRRINVRGFGYTRRHCQGHVMDVISQASVSLGAGHVSLLITDVFPNKLK